MPNFTDRTLRRLKAPINPRRVRRLDAGPAKGAPYLDGEDVIDTLNEIFGYGEWSFELVGQPWVAESGVEGSNKTTPYEVWCCIGTLTVGGAKHSGFGTNVRSGTGSAGLEMAIKGATTDALKRAAVHYGDQFGLGLRDKPDDRDMVDAWNKWVEAEKARRANAQAEGAHIAQPDVEPAPHASASPDRSPAPSEPQEAERPAGGRLTLAEVEAEFRAEKRSSGIGGAWLSRSDTIKPLTQELIDRWCAQSPGGSAAELVYESMVWMAGDAANKSIAESCQRWLDERKEHAA